MLQLTEFEFETLRQIVRNGSMELGRGCLLSTAIRLQLNGLVVIEAGGPRQRVVATRAGESFHYRGAA